MLEIPYVAENKEGTSHYGYGWAILKSKRGTKIVTHNGSNGIYFADFIRFVDEDVVVIVLSNVGLNSDSENVAWEISNMIFDPNYNTKPVSKLSYQLVYEFMEVNKKDSANQLQYFLDDNLETKFRDKAVFNRIGFKLLEKENEPGWGLELLKLNTQLFLDDGNLWDSLGDAYYKYGQKENAIKAYSKALVLSPNQNCHWCENSQSKLNQLKDY